MATADHDQSQQQTIKEPFDDPPEFPSQYRGLTLAAQAVGLGDHKRLLDSHAKNLQRAWQMGMKALGQDDIDDEVGDDMAGDVNVAGDTHIHVVPDSQPQTPQPPQPQLPQAKPNWLPWALAAAIGVGNLAGGAYLLNQFSGGPDSTERTTIGLSTGQQ